MGSCRGCHLWQHHQGCKCRCGGASGSLNQASSMSLQVGNASCSRRGYEWLC